MTRVGKHIRAIRQAQGLTQEQVGERAGLNYKFVGLIERGDRNPSAESLEKLAKGLNVLVGDFFPDTSSRTNREKLIQSILGILGDKDPKELRLAKRMLEAMFTDTD